LHFLCKPAHQMTLMAFRLTETFMNAQTEDHLPANKEDIKALLSEIKALFSTDILVLRVDMATLAGRIQAVEANVGNYGSKQQDMATAPTQLQHKQQLHDTKLAEMENFHWCQYLWIGS
ncbi:Hypothetical predicted protein, partial [Pelobates cultripes]